MRIFLLIPFTREFEDIHYALRESIENTGHQLIRMSELMSTGSFNNQLQEEISKADLIIADVSSHNPNVMFEVGYAKSLNVPILLISQQNEYIPFDISSIQVLIYDRSRLHQTLTTKIRNFLSHTDFKKFYKKEQEDLEKEIESKKSIFVSYSHEDYKYLERLKVHLKPFEKSGLIDVWSDTKIKAGEKWKEKIEIALEKSAIAILLVSADFLASDFIVDNELPPLLKAAESEGKIILPVILKPCRFSRNKNLSKFQAINNPKMPLSKMDENTREETYVKIADFIDDSL